MQTSATRAYRGAGMEGWVARWYTRTRRHDMEDFRRQAGKIAQHLPAGCDVLEVAPGPGFFAIELAKLGDFHITAIDVSHTFIHIASRNAADAGVKVDFRLGSASTMPFADASFDFVYCFAAFKNFAEPIEAINQMHRVLRPGGQAIIGDLCKDASIDQINAYLLHSGRNRFDAWLTRWIFRHMLIKRAYTREQFLDMARQSRFGDCQVDPADLGIEVHFSKPAESAAAVA